MRYRTYLFVASATCALLSGCADLMTFFNDASSAPKEARFVMELEGQGYQQFQCSRDRDGYYWRFVTPSVRLLDSQGRLVATQGADFAFTGSDGSLLRAKIVASEATSTHSRLKNVLFKVTAHGKKRGQLSSFLWVRRTSAKGGIPQTVCSSSHLSEVVKVPFSATYAFYR